MSCNSRTLTTAQIRQLVIHDREELGEEDLLATLQRPMTRGECVYGVRPCPWVGCKHNLYLDVNPKNGSIKLNFPDLEPGEMDPERSCALDVAEKDGLILEGVAEAMGDMTRERVRQIEDQALRRINPAALSSLIDAEDEDMLCQCGCGEEVTGKRKGARFINKQHRDNHYNRTQRKGRLDTADQADPSKDADMANTRSKADYEKLLREQINENKRLKETNRSLSEQCDLLREQLDETRRQAEAARLNDQDAARVKGLKAEVARLEEVVAVKDRRINALEQRLTETSLNTQTIQVSEPQLLSAVVAPLDPDTITAAQMKAVLHEALEIAKMVREAA